MLPITSSNIHLSMSWTSENDNEATSIELCQLYFIFITWFMCELKTIQADWLWSATECFRCHFSSNYCVARKAKKTSKWIELNWIVTKSKHDPVDTKYEKLLQNECEKRAKIIIIFWCVSLFCNFAHVRHCGLLPVDNTLLSLLQQSVVLQAFQFWYLDTQSFSLHATNATTTAAAARYWWCVNKYAGLIDMHGSGRKRWWNSEATFVVSTQWWCCCCYCCSFALSLMCKIRFDSVRIL